MDAAPDGRRSPASTRLTTIVGAVAATLAVVGAVVLVRHLRERPAPPPPVVRLAFAAPLGAELGAGDEPLDAAISPDQRQVVFVATAGGVARLWRRALEAAQAEAMSGTEGARLPAWKPTGQVISFFVGDRLKQVSLADGAIRDLGEVAGAAGAVWRQDGSLLFGSAGHPIRQLKGGVVADVTSLHGGDRGHAFPMTTGTADDFVYVTIREDDRRIARLHMNGQDRDLTETAGHAQLIGDRLLFVRDGVLLAQRFDPETQALVGRSSLIASEVGTAGGRGFFAASPRVLLTAPAAARARQLVWLDGDRRVATSGDSGDYWQVRLSPDDRYAAVTALDPLLRTLDVIVLAASGTAPREPLTLALAADSDPVWSPDGTRVLFRSMQDGVANVYARRAHTPDAKDEAILKSELDETPSDWFESTLLFTAPRKGLGTDVWQFDTRSRELVGIATSGFNESDARMSPDGDWVAYVSDESGRPDIYVAPFPEGERIRVSFDGGIRPRWSRDGATIFFVRGAQIMRSDMQETPTVGFSPAAPVASIPGLRDFDVAHRSDQIVALVPVNAHPDVNVAASIDWASIVK